MANAVKSEGEDVAVKKKSRGLLIGLVTALLLGGGAFYGVYSGLVPLPFGDEGLPKHANAKNDAEAEAANAAFKHGSFVAMEPLIISLGETARAKHLRVTISLEVDPTAETAVTDVKPRINDVLNTYLRAVDEREFEIPSAMLRLRAQMLRRIQLVTPPQSVSDVLIQEFVLN